MNDNDRESLQILVKLARARGLALQKWLLRALCTAVLALILIYDISAGWTFASLVSGFLLTQLIFASHVGFIGGTMMSRVLEEEEENDQS